MGNNSQKQGSSSSSSQILHIKALFWRSEQENLFDFQSKDVIKNKFVINQSGFMIANMENEIKFTNQIDSLKEQFLQINHTGSKFILQNETMGTDENQGVGEKSVWIIIKTFHQKGIDKGLYQLDHDDYLKIGRVRFRVKEINPDGDQTQQEPVKKKLPTIFIENILNKEDILAYSSQYGIKPVEPIQCRICLGETYSPQNPFIQPCKCIGSVQHIHLVCLKLWLQNKMQIKKSDFLCEYEWKNQACELCKHPFPSYVNVDGVNFSTFSIKNPTGPYIVLEKLRKESNECKSQIIISFTSMFEKDDKQIKELSILKIGRGGGSEVRLNDISVSREHAHLIFKDKKIFLRDENSKFGTLVLVKNPIAFSDLWNKVSIQVGKVVLELKLKNQTSSLFSCTTKQKDDQEEQYNAEDKLEMMRMSVNKQYFQRSNFQNSPTKARFQEKD